MNEESFSSDQAVAKYLNENFIKNSLSFTPNDCSTLWEYIEESFDDDLIEGLSPDEYFDESRMLTLNDCLKYEIMLKKFIVNLEDKDEITILRCSRTQRKSVRSKRIDKIAKTAMKQTIKAKS